jgi:hypothetical protein
MTGESDDVRKSSSETPVLLSGSKVGLYQLNLVDLYQ